MSPLLFLAIAVVVPLLGMIVLGVGARIRNQQVTDDETKPFRRRLESLAPPETHDARSSGTPGLRHAMRRLRGSGPAKKATGQAAAPDRAEQAAPASIRLVERDYALPPLPPLSADLDEPPPPAGDGRSRRATPRPPGAERRRDRVISPSQGRRSGS